MTALTLMTILFWFVALVKRKPLLAVALGGALPTGAFISFGDIALPVVYGCAVFAIFGHLLLRKQEDISQAPAQGTTVLWIFALWVVLVTVLSPFIFAGIQVMSLGGYRRTINPETFLTSSNTAQLLYLILGTAIAVIAAAKPETTMWYIFGALAGAALLSTWRYLGLNLGLPFPYGFFDNSTAFRYIDGAPGGIVRFRGIFSEPAALATSSLPCVAMGLSLLSRAHGGRRLLVAAGVLCAAFNLSQSTSATGVLATALVAAIAASEGLSGLVFRGQRRSTSATVLVVAVMFVAIWVLPLISAYLQDVVDSKVGTSSYDERSGSDQYSLGLLAQTYGFGVGIGSNRPSSFLAAMLAGTGVVGTVLFFGVVIYYGVVGSKVVTLRPVLWCLLSTIVAKLVASPDLSDPTGVLWLSIGAVVGSNSVDAVSTLQPQAMARPRHRIMG